MNMTGCLTQENYLRTEHIDERLVVTEIRSGARLTFALKADGSPTDFLVDGNRADLRFLISVEAQQLKNTHPDVLWQEVVEQLYGE